MEAREDALQSAFGPTSPPDQVIAPSHPACLGVPGFCLLRFPRAKGRTYWLYTTHGLAQPSSAAEAKPGHHIGFELSLATKRSVTWPIPLLETFAAYLIQSGRPVVVHDRLPSSDLMADGPGGGLLVLAKPGHATRFETTRGTFELLTVVGATTGELAAARELPGRTGSAVLEAVLHASGIGCVTDRKRTCLTKTTGYRQAWRRAVEALAD